jgi:hypothetical protein
MLARCVLIVAQSLTARNRVPEKLTMNISNVVLLFVAYVFFVGLVLTLNRGADLRIDHGRPNARDDDRIKEAISH